MSLEAFEIKSPEEPFMLGVKSVGEFGSRDNPVDFSYGGASVLPEGSPNPEDYVALDEELFAQRIVVPNQPIRIMNPKTKKMVVGIARHNQDAGSEHGMSLAAHTILELGGTKDLLVDFRPVKNYHVANYSHPYAPPKQEEIVTDAPQEGQGLGSLGMENERPGMRYASMVDTAEVAGTPAAAKTPPDPNNPKFLTSNPDGSRTYDNGETIFPDGRSERKVAGGNRIMVIPPKGGGKPYLVPVTAQSKPIRNPGDGKYYDMSDPANPKEVKFPTPAPVGSGEDVLKGLSEQDAATVKKMASYDWPVPPGGIRNPHQLDLLQKAVLYDPTFSPAEYSSRQSSKRDYTSGKTFNNIRSLNTLAGHLDNLDRHAKALDNSWNPASNAVKNWFNSSVQGKSEKQLFDADIIAVTNELGQLLAGKAITDSEAKRWDAVISSSSSPEQLKNTIKEYADIARSRLDSIKQGYEGVMRKPADIQILSPKAKDVFVKLGVMTKEEAEALPEGAKGKASPTPTPVPVIQTATGPAKEGVVYTKPDGTRYIIRNGKPEPYNG